MIIDSTFKCTQETFNKATSRSLILLTCIECDKDYMRIKKEILNTFTKYGTKPKFCSKSCLGKNKKKSIETSCNNCNKTINKVLNQYNSSKNHFCSRSCSATWNNKNKTHGTRRSRLEVYLENELTKLYPNLKIEYSGKTAIGSEIDIYIPSLKLAFEIQGIFHYSPIFGLDKLEQIQKNDKEKQLKCEQYGITLVTIDTQFQKRFTEKSSIKYLEEILSYL